MTWLWVVTHVAPVVLLYLMYRIVRVRLYHGAIGRALLFMVFALFLLSMAGMTRRYEWEYSNYALAAGWTIVVSAAVGILLTPNDEHKCYRRYDDE